MQNSKGSHVYVTENYVNRIYKFSFLFAQSCRLSSGVGLTLIQYSAGFPCSARDCLHLLSAGMTAVGPPCLVGHYDFQQACVL